MKALRSPRKILPPLRYESVPEERQDDIIRAFDIAGPLEIVTLCGFYG